MRLERQKCSRRQNAKNHLLVQQVTTKKHQWIAAIETSVLRPASVKKRTQHCWIQGHSTMTLIIYNNAKEKAIGNTKKMGGISPSQF